MTAIFDLGMDLGEHATCLVGVRKGVDGHVSGLLLQNSHGAGSAPGHGYLLMTVEWFLKYVNIVVVDSSVLQRFASELLPSEPVTQVMPIWDRIGTLAQVGAT